MSENIPREWDLCAIGNHIEFLTDYTANGSFASLKENVQYFNEKNYAALIRTTDLEKNFFSPQRFTDKKGYEFLKKSSLNKGDIVIANVVISWLIAFNVLNTSNRFVYSILDFTYRMTDPFLNKIRRFLPNLGAFDISPIVLLLLIWFIEMCMKLYIAPIIF